MSFCLLSVAHWFNWGCLHEHGLGYLMKQRLLTRGCTAGENACLSQSSQQLPIPPQIGVVPCKLLPRPWQGVDWPILVQSCGGDCSCCKFLSGVVMLYPEGRFPQQPSPTTSPNIPPPPCSKTFSEPWRGWHNYRTPSRCWVITITPSNVTQAARVLNFSLWGSRMYSHLSFFSSLPFFLCSPYSS